MGAALGAVAATADKYKGQAVVEPRLAARKPSEKDVPIINKTLSINFTPGALARRSVTTSDTAGLGCTGTTTQIL